VAVTVEPWREDPAPLMSLARAVGWEWSEARARRAQRVKPGMTWLAHADGALAGTVSVFVYGDAGAGPLAWLCGMVVHPDHQKKGVGRALMGPALAFAREHGALVIGLDATPAGRPVYERHGFRALAEDPRWHRDPARAPVPPSAPQGPISVYPISSCEIMELHAYDAARFGANRAGVLAEPMADRPQHCFVAFDRKTGAVVGHVLSQEKGIGPLVADTPHAAEWLLYAAEMAGAVPVAHLPGLNPAAQKVFARAGYAPSGNACTRMVLGGDLPGRPETTYALAGWGWG
jgi:GNAT superfamily N-acetyltransferase